jgi:hypothetical protein
VGDGATPRTAALFAFLSKGGTCFAVDPLLEEGAAKLAKKAGGAGAKSTRHLADHNVEFFSKMMSGGR